MNRGQITVRDDEDGSSNATTSCPKQRGTKPGENGVARRCPVSTPRFQGRRTTEDAHKTKVGNGSEDNEGTPSRTSSPLPNLNNGRIRGLVRGRRTGRTYELSLRLASKHFQVKNQACTSTPGQSITTDRRRQAVLPASGTPWEPCRRYLCPGSHRCRQVLKRFDGRGHQ